MNFYIPDAPDTPDTVCECFQTLNVVRMALVRVICHFESLQMLVQGVSANCLTGDEWNKDITELTFATNQEGMFFFPAILHLQHFFLKDWLS